MEHVKEKKMHFLYRLFCPNEIFWHLCFMSMHGVLNTLSEYTYFCISKKFTSYTFLFVFKIVKSFQCILKLCKEVEKLHRWACLEAAVCSVLQKRYSLKLCKIHGKAHRKWQVSESKRLLFIQKETLVQSLFSWEIFGVLSKF